MSTKRARQLFCRAEAEPCSSIKPSKASVGLRDSPHVFLEAGTEGLKPPARNSLYIVMIEQWYKFHKSS